VFGNDPAPPGRAATLEGSDSDEELWYSSLDGPSWPTPAVIPVQTDRNEPGKTSVNSIIAWGGEYYGLVFAAARSAPGLPAPTAVAFAWLNESISPEVGALA
jgi:hypothetical protein